MMAEPTRPHPITPMRDREGEGRALRTGEDRMEVTTAPMRKRTWIRITVTESWRMVEQRDMEGSRERREGRERRMKEGEVVELEDDGLEDDGLEDDMLEESQVCSEVGSGEKERARSYLKLRGRRRMGEGG